MLLINIIFLAVLATIIEYSAGQQHIVLTGVQTGIKNGVIPYRRDIRDLRADNLAWSLFIQALRALQGESESNLLSYYQIAGIHGRPYISWDNNYQGPGAWTFGYCIHGSSLFATWHRPYLALFEQALVNNAQKIAKRYPLFGRQSWVAAAETLRMPFWDWASDARMPDFLNIPAVTITTPFGVQSVTNPLAAYKFQSTKNPDLFPSQQATADDWYLSAPQQTLRNPDTRGGISNFERANNELVNNGFKEQTYTLLTKAPDFNSFTTSATEGSSIEVLHNNIHADIGGQWGHMRQLGYAAFDPIFWLHHANVDRLTALYQAMHPNLYLTPSIEIYGTFAFAPGINSDENTPLAPFSNDKQGDLYTSASSRSLRTFGYSYPELQYWNQSPQQLQSSAIASVNNLYGPSGQQTNRRRASGARNQVSEWSAAVRVSKFGASGRSFIVRLFLGSVPENPHDWATDPKTIGSFAVLPPPIRPAGPTENFLTYYELSLTKSLKAKGFDGQDIDTTSEYLKNSLQWRVQLIDGTVATTEDIKDLIITVQEETVALGRSSSELPIYKEDKTLHPEITEGKAGGYVRE